MIACSTPSCEAVGEVQNMYANVYRGNPCPTPPAVPASRLRPRPAVPSTAVPSPWVRLA
ncbi:hypothetical protein ACFFX0_32045 [Citricoccus parietis]|uniref:Uncharacterized protein n=1 Tax=Citricoccus parietis TaxID=592307 RepID=A0ABV5G9E4_9MICC